MGRKSKLFCRGLGCRRPPKLDGLCEDHNPSHSDRLQTGKKRHAACYVARGPNCSPLNQGHAHWATCERSVALAAQCQHQASCHIRPADRRRPKRCASARPRPRKRVHAKVHTNICLYRSPRLLARYIHLTQAEREEVVPPCGRPSDGDACTMHAGTLATAESVARLDADFRPVPVLTGPRGPVQLAEPVALGLAPWPARFGIVTPFDWNASKGRVKKDPGDAATRGTGTATRGMVRPTAQGKRRGESS